MTGVHPQSAELRQWANTATSSNHAKAPKRLLRAAADELDRLQQENEILGDALDASVTGMIERSKLPRWDEDKLVLSQGWNTPDRCGQCGERNAEVADLRAQLGAAQQALATIASGPTHAPGCDPTYCDCDAKWEWPEEVLRLARAAGGGE